MSSGKEPGRVREDAIPPKMESAIREEIVKAAHVLDAQGLVTAFGHVSARSGPNSFLVTPPKPLGSIRPGEPLLEVSLVERELPWGVPGEVWIHRAIYEKRPDILAVCRAQPAITTAMSGAGVSIKALHGQGAFLGKQTPVFEDARLIRSRELGNSVAECLGDEGGIVLRGNGAVTLGGSVGEAVARMWVLEASAEINWRASSAGHPRPLDGDEFSYWVSVSEEILQRIWAYLKEQ